MIVNYRDSKDNEVLFWSKNPDYIPNVNEKVRIKFDSNFITGFVIDKTIGLWDYDKDFVVIDIIIKVNL